MYPELFRIPLIDWPVHSYGLMLVIGLLLAIELAKFLARRGGMNAELFANAGILALVSGIIGARILYVIQFNEEFRDPKLSFWENAGHALNITSGGLVYYGGFLFATATLIGYALWKKIPVRRGMDVIAPCLMIGLAFGRIGCLLNGCCSGSTCDLPWAVTFPYASETFGHQFNDDRTHDAIMKKLPPELLRVTDEGIALRPAVTKEQRDAALALRSLPVHPTQIYSFITAGLIAVVTYLFFTLDLPAGRGFALMLMLEGGTRAVIETLRVEPTVGAGLTLSEWIGLGCLAAGVVMWFACRTDAKPANAPRYVRPATA